MSDPSNEDILEYNRLLQEKLRLLEEQEKLKRCLPHLHADKEYIWSRRFIESKSKRLVLVCANQIGKSTSQIKRVLDFITNVDKWPERWPKLHAMGKKPTRFWLLYPDSKTATAEFEDKWMPFLPKEEFKDHPHYGWKKPNYSNGRIESVEFLNGITLEFRTYSQDAANLQAGSLAYIGTDEELPFHLYPELSLRVEAQEGYMSFVFTATLGQSEFVEIVEDRTSWNEPDDEIMQVSMYDCQFFEDGTPGLWPLEKIERVKARLGTEAEIQRRVYGRFVVDSGRKYPQFDRRHHLIRGHPLPLSWQYYAGVDYGGGGEEQQASGKEPSHPSAICILGIDPEYKRGRIVKLWRGDGVLTTAEDVVKKYIDLTTGLPPLSAAFFDWAAKDLGTFASRLGLPFSPAEKSHTIGETTLNTLFKMRALLIHDSAGDTEKLAREFEGLLNSTNKKRAKDDLVDAVRYACAKIPWNWEEISKALPIVEPERELTYDERQIQERRGNYDKTDENIDLGIEQELDFWNGMFDQ